MKSVMQFLKTKAYLEQAGLQKTKHLILIQTVRHLLGFLL